MDDNIDYLYRRLMRCDALNASLDTKTYVALTAQAIFITACVGVAIYIAPLMPPIWRQIRREINNGFNPTPPNQMGTLLQTVSISCFMLGVLFALGGLFSSLTVSASIIVGMTNDAGPDESTGYFRVYSSFWRFNPFGTPKINQVLAPKKDIVMGLDELRGYAETIKRADVFEELTRKIMVVEYCYDTRRKGLLRVPVMLIFELLGIALTALGCIGYGLSG